MESLNFELSSELSSFFSIFGGGFAVGLVISFLLWISTFNKLSSVRKENVDLKNHLNTQLTITAKGYEELKKELDSVKKQNENLRLTLGTLSSKPGRAELKQLHIWDRAIRSLVLQSPAFAPAWEMAIAEAKKEVDETDSGMKALVRRVFSILPQEATTESHDV